MIKLKKKSLLELCCLIVLFTIMWIMSGWNTYNTDMENYEISYSIVSPERISFTQLDFGAHVIEYFFSNYGFGYEEYRIAIYFICLLVIFYITIQWSETPVLVIIFYLLEHFLRDCIETRNFIASIFVLLAIHLYLKNKKSYYNYIAALFLFFAFTVHAALGLCFVFVFITIKKRFSIWPAIIFTCVLTLGTVPIMRSVVSFIDIEDLTRKSNNILDKMPLFSFALALVLSILNAFVITHFNKIAYKLNPNITINNIKLLQISSVIYKMNVLSCVFLLFSVVSYSFYCRLFGNIMILNIIFILNVFKYAKNKNIGDFILVFVYMVVFIYWMKMVPFEYHFLSVLLNNSIIHL